MPDAVGLPLRALAELSGKPLAEVYRLFRLPTAPTPVAHVACVPVYEPRAALTHVLGAGEAVDAAMSRLQARIDARIAASQPPPPVSPV